MVSFQPEKLEQLLKIKEGRRRFTLGLPSAASGTCPPVLLTPEGVSMLVSQGIEVKVEKGLGGAINYDDARYSGTGAEIATHQECLMCDVVIYAGNMKAEDAMRLKHNGVLLTLLRNRPLNIETLQILTSRRITVLGLDKVRDNRGLSPVADILGEVNGRAAITAATTLLSDPCVGKGILLGGVAGVNPCEIVILGTGMSALAAARSAIGLGGMVRLFDSDPYCLRAAMSELGPAVVGSALHPVVLGHALASADVVIATRLNRRFAIDDSVLESMKKGVVIIDLNDHDGISGTFPALRCMNVSQVLEENEVPGPHICLTNPMGIVPRTAAMAMTNDMVPIIDRLFGSGAGLMNVLKTDGGLRAAVIAFRGRIVNRDVAERVGVRFVDINLLLSFS